MCRILGLSRQSYYYQSKPKKDESELEEVVAEEESYELPEESTGFTMGDILGEALKTEE